MGRRCAASSKPATRAAATALGGDVSRASNERHGDSKCTALYCSGSQLPLSRHSFRLRNSLRRMNWKFWGAM